MNLRTQLVFAMCGAVLLSSVGACSAGTTRGFEPINSAVPPAAGSRKHGGAAAVAPAGPGGDRRE